MEFERVLYCRERYACLLAVRPDRIIRSGYDCALKEPERVAATMTQWIRRILRDQPVVVGMAEVVASVDVLSDIPAIMATSNVYLDVRPEHVVALRGLVDHDGANAVEIPTALR